MRRAVSGSGLLEKVKETISELALLPATLQAQAAHDLLEFFDLFFVNAGLHVLLRREGTAFGVTTPPWQQARARTQILARGGARKQNHSVLAGLRW